MTNTSADFAVTLNPDIGEQPKQVDPEPIVIKGDDMKPMLIIDRSYNSGEAQ